VGRRSARRADADGKSRADGAGDRRRREKVGGFVKSELGGQLRYYALDGDAARGDGCLRHEK